MYKNGFLLNFFDYEGRLTRGGYLSNEYGIAEEVFVYIEENGSEVIEGEVMHYTIQEVYG